MSPHHQTRLAAILLAVVAMMLVGLLGPESWRPVTINLVVVGYLVYFWYRGIVWYPQKRWMIYIAVLFTILALVFWGSLLWS